MATNNQGNNKAAQGSNQGAMPAVFNYDGSIAYYENLKLSITPAPYEAENGDKTPHGDTVSFRGRCTISGDGTAVVMGYHEKARTRSKVLFCTAHANVRQAPDGHIKLDFNFEEGTPLKLIAKMMKDESRGIMEYFNAKANV